MTLEIKDKGQLRKLRDRAIDTNQSLAATASELLTESLKQPKRQKINKYAFYSKAKAG